MSRFDEALVVGGAGTLRGPGEVNIGPAVACAQWNGTEWIALGAEGSGAGVYSDAPTILRTHRGQITALRAEAETLWVGGHFTSVRDGNHWLPVSNVAAWDGEHWTALGSEIDGTVLAFARYRGELIAAGAFNQWGPGDAPKNIARWDGTRWQPLGGGLEGVGVYTLLAAGDSLIASGYIGGVFVWNGESWESLGPKYSAGDGGGGGVSALATYDGSIVGAVGSNFYGWPRAVVRWDGARWQLLGSDLQIHARVLTHHDGFLIAGGPEGLARWDGSSWNPFASDAPSRITALCSDGVDLYVGGSFDSAGTIRSPGIVGWVDSRWQGLGSGLGPPSPYLCTSIAKFQGTLFAGGMLAQAGGKPSSFLARWDGLRGPAAPHEFAIGSGRPNPFTGQVAVPFSVRTRSRVVVSIVDATGRRMRTLMNETLPAGPHTATWDGMSTNGHRARPGVYYVTVLAAGEDRRSRKVVLLP